MNSPKRFLLRNVAVVVRGDRHNPTILNPDFLKASGIVRDSWKPSATLTTPAVAQTKYPGGVVIQVDPEILTVIQSMNGEFADDYVAHEIAERYVTTLPHVSYSAVGLNWQVTYDVEDSTDWLGDRYLKYGTWRTEKPTPELANMTLSVQLENAVCNLTAQLITRPLEGGREQPAIGVDCNFHHEGPTDSERMKAIVSRAGELQKELLRLLNRFFVKDLK